jgi:hypothetical protein
MCIFELLWVLYNFCLYIQEKEYRVEEAERMKERKKERKKDR